MARSAFQGNRLRNPLPVRPVPWPKKTERITGTGVVSLLNLDILALYRSARERARLQGEKALIPLVAVVAVAVATAVTVAAVVIATGSSGAGSAVGSVTANSTAKKADEVVLMSSLGLDIIGMVVGVVAGEHLAAGDGMLPLGGHDDFHADVVARVDDGGDIEEGNSLKRVEGELAKHAGHVRPTVTDGIVVANPSMRDALSGGGLSLDAERLDLG